MLKKFQTRWPMGRPGEPDDIAKVVLFYASEAVNYVTVSVSVTIRTFSPGLTPMQSLTAIIALFLMSIKLTPSMKFISYFLSIPDITLA